MIHIDKSVN